MKLDLFTTILIGLALLILVFLYIGNKKKWFEPKLPDLELTSDGGGYDPNMARYTNITNGVRSDLYAYNVTDEGMRSTYNSLIGLSDNELRMVVNEYNRLFKGEEMPTLRALLNGESLACGSIWTLGYVSPACSWRREILDRLSAIGA